MSYTPFIVIGIWLGVMTLMFGQGKFIKYFNLVDKRSLVGSDATYQKLNSLMLAGDVSLFRHEFMDEQKVSLRATYKVNKAETSEISISGNSLDGVVAVAYEAALAKGFIK